MKLKATWSDCVRGKCGEEWDKCGGSVAIRPGAEPVEGVEAEGHMERLREGKCGEEWWKCGGSVAIRPGIAEPVEQREEEVWGSVG